MLIADYKFNNESDLFPVFNEEFTYTYEDVLENNITHRKIYADTLPTSISFPEALNLIECGYLALDNVTTLAEAFVGCESLQLIDGTDWNVSGISSFDMTFCYCSKLTDIIGIENWNTTNLGNNNSRALVATFGFCSSLKTINLSNWEVNYTISCNSTFTTCTEVTEIFLPKKFSPINILAMFQNCNSLIEIHGLERIKCLTDGSNRRTFENCYSLKKVSMPYLDASLATRLDTMFSNCTSLEEINFSHIKINDSCIVTTFLNNCTSLKSIKISADSLPVIQSIVQQLPDVTSGSFTVIGAENIMSELKELLKSTNWNIVPLGRKLCTIKNNSSKGTIKSGGSTIVCKIFGKLDFNE